MESNKCKARKESGVTEEEIEILLGSVEKFTLVSHLLWGMWALIQAEHSSIDFDFLGYASIRLNQYFVRKKKIFQC